MCGCTNESLVAAISPTAAEAVRLGAGGGGGGGVGGGWGRLPHLKYIIGGSVHMVPIGSIQFWSGREENGLGPVRAGLGFAETGSCRVGLGRVRPPLGPAVPRLPAAEASRRPGDGGWACCTWGTRCGSPATSAGTWAQTHTHRRGVTRMSRVGGRLA